MKPPIRLVDHQSRLVVNGPLQVVGLDCVPRWDLLSHVCVDPTWWPIPLTKWVITQVTSGLTLLVPLITRVIRDLLSGVNRQAKNFKTVDFIGEVRLFRATRTGMCHNPLHQPWFGLSHMSDGISRLWIPRPFKWWARQHFEECKQRV